MLAAVLVTACAKDETNSLGPPPPPAIAGLTVDTPALTIRGLAVGAQLAAVAVDQSGRVTAASDFTWSSSDSTVVRVAEASGRRATIRSVAPGSARVVVS